MRGGSWQRSHSTRQVKLADEDILREVAGAMCDLSISRLKQRVCCFIMSSAT